MHRLIEFSDDYQIVTQNEILKLAFLFATKKHAQQTRTFNGEPYMCRPFRVARSVSSSLNMGITSMPMVYSNCSFDGRIGPAAVDALCMFSSALRREEEFIILIAVSFLHDVLEDTNTSEKELLSLFGERITNLVIELTSDEQKINETEGGKTAYLAKKMLEMSDYALFIKLADRLDNIADLTTTSNPSQNTWSLNYAFQTRRILAVISTQRKLGIMHIEFNDIITLNLDLFDVTYALKNTKYYE